MRRSDAAVPSRGFSGNRPGAPYRAWLLAGRIACAAIGGLLAAPPVLAAGLLTLEPAPGEPPRIAITRVQDRSIGLTFELADLPIEPVSTDAGEFQQVSIPGGAFTGNDGEPAVPVYHQLIAVPEGAALTLSAEVLEEDEIADIRLLPIQPVNAAGISPSFAFDAAAYTRPAVARPPIVEIGPPALLRDMWVVDLTVRPVHFDPTRNTLRVARRLRIDVAIEGGTAAQPLVERRTIPASFDRLYRQLIANYDGPQADQTVAPGTYMIICHPDPEVVSRLEPLVEWRRRSGYRTLLLTTAETGGTAFQIRSSIQAFYNDPESALEYVVLAGDATGNYLVPTWFEQLSGHVGEGDLPYSLLAGDDLLPEVHVGRLSFGNLEELERIVNKIIGYESRPELNDPGWFTRACVVGDPTDSGWSTVITGQWLKGRLLEAGYTQVDTVWSEPFVYQMGAALDQGCSVFGYRGFYGMSGWSAANTYQLQNDWKMPFAVVVTCETGSFAEGTARVEHLLRAGNGTQSPRGAIGAIGTATGGTHTRYNNCVYYGIFRGLLQEEQHTMGAALTRGKIELYRNYSMSEPHSVEIWSHWNNLMGDPAVDVWTAYPWPLEVNHPASLPTGRHALPVTVRTDGAPVPDALVCAWKGDETHAVAYTNADGYAELPIDAPTDGDLLLTVTRHNLYPYLATMPIYHEYVAVSVAQTAIDDDALGASNGNDDGLLNPLETVELVVALRNAGSQPAAEVSAYLTCLDPYVTILDGTASFGTIGGGATTISDDPFGFSVDGACPQGHRLRFACEVTAGSGAWRSLFDLEVISADLVTRTTELHAAGPNGILDPGETAELTVEIENLGGAPATGVSTVLRSLGPSVTVTDSTADYGAIAVGEAVANTTRHFTVTASPEVFPGHLASLELITKFSGGSADTASVELVVGERGETDPIGPDRYGYVAFDDTDTTYAEAPTYDWVEIDQSHGGDGTRVYLGDNGQYRDVSKIVELPFWFRYYGLPYNRITVCSNGWLAMGESYLTSYRNWTIPGAGGPAAMVAPFWDNLFESARSKLFVKHDVSGGRFIIEWSRFHNMVHGLDETFQVILYDPAHHVTETGDGIIEFHYHSVNNVDQLNGFATVGIESPDMLDGVLYTYWNRYAGGAAPLEAGRAIRFVPFSGGALGTLEGNVLNASSDDAPIAGVRVELLDSDSVFASDGDGRFRGLAPARQYVAVTEHESFSSDTASVVIVADGVTRLDFRLHDIAAPIVTTTQHPWTASTAGPYPVPVEIVEYSGLNEQTVYYRRAGHGEGGETGIEYTALPLQPPGDGAGAPGSATSGAAGVTGTAGATIRAAATGAVGATGASHDQAITYRAEIPGQPLWTAIEYYVRAEDAAGHVTLDPPGAPTATYIFHVAPMEVVIDDDLERDVGWTVGAPDDDATAGIWVRADPVGTELDGQPVQCENDHTADPGVCCFATANGPPEGAAGSSDVDGGRTTLLSPLFDLDGYSTSTVSYCVWYSNDRGGFPGEDTLVVQVNGDGAHWVDLERIGTATRGWAERHFVLDDLIEMTGTVQFRFIAADEGNDSIVEAAIDDFSLVGRTLHVGQVPEAAPVHSTALAPCRPNPFNPATAIGYRIAAPGTVTLRIYDVGGRLVRTLIDRAQPAGGYTVSWAGRDDTGENVASGVYYVRMDTPGFSQVRRVTLVR